MTIFRSNNTAGLIIEPDNSGNIVFVTGEGNVAMRLESSGMVNLSQTRLILPAGNTATRTANAQAGTLRFNNETFAFEAYNGTNWSTLTPVRS